MYMKRNIKAGMQLWNAKVMLQAGVALNMPIKN